MFAGKWIYRCNHCGHCFCHPEISNDALHRYYRNGYWNGARTGRSATAGKVWQSIRSNIRQLILPNFRAASGVKDLRDLGVRAKTVLDIGAGRGDAARYLRRAYGAVVHVVEPSSAFEELYARNEVRRVASHLGGVDRSLRYDIIHSSHWLEHMTNPRSLVNQIRSLLSANGVVLADVPNCESPYWDYRLSPVVPHVQFFTLDSLRLLFELEGFAVATLTTNGPPIEWEKEIGTVRPETALLISGRENDELAVQRRRRARAKIRSLSVKDRVGFALHGMYRKYSDRGGSNLRIIASRNDFNWKYSQMGGVS